MSRKQTVFFSMATVAVLVVCAVLPLGFISPQLPDNEGAEYLSMSQKTDIFLTYWNEGYGDGRGGYEYEELSRDDLSAESLDLCVGIKDLLWDNFTVDDVYGEFEVQGETFFKMTNERGQEVRFYHAWYRWTGSWSNWFNLCTDVDTGVIYYFYVSSVFLENLMTTKEVPAAPDLGQTAAASMAVAPYTDSVAMASLWSRFCGYELVSVRESGESSDDGTPIYSAAYLAENEELSYNVSCKYYPRSLLDIKLTVR